MTRFDIADVRHFYDRHTRSFIRFGQGGGAGAIHRAVWGPGVRTRQEAFHYVDDRIADLARGLPASSTMPHLVDLGCGVGSSLCYLAERLPVRGTGITLSPLQARLAAQRIHGTQLSNRVTCLEGDYSTVPARVQRADLAFAIESFVHGPAPGPVLAAWARLVRPGGVLVICDDFRRATDSEAAARAIDRFRRGWRINSLLSRDELQACARMAGFDHESSVDLSAALETGRARDRIISRLCAVAEWLAPGAGRLDYLVGGSALQECLANGWIGYDFSVFRRRA
jgi:SAM-dependent methyltransferase